MKKPTKKELREMSDDTLITELELTGSKLERLLVLHFQPDSNSNTADVYRAQDRRSVIRSEILRRMGGAK